MGDKPCPDANRMRGCCALKSTAAFILDTFSWQKKKKRVFLCAERRIKVLKQHGWMVLRLLSRVDMHTYLLTHTHTHTHADTHWLAVYQRISQCSMYLRHRGGREWMFEERQTLNVWLCSVSSHLTLGQLCSQALNTEAETMWRGNLWKS